MGTSVRIGSLVAVLVGSLVWMAPAATAAPAERSVTITVPERAGAARTGEYVSFGVPIPRAWKVTDVSPLRLMSPDGKAIPAQFEALACWAGAPERLLRMTRPVGGEWLME